MSAAEILDGCADAGVYADADAEQPSEDRVSSIFELAPRVVEAPARPKLRLASVSSVFELERARREREAARDEAEMEDRRRRACARVIVRRMRPPA